MLPTFEIFLSILTDSWMPWLKENRNTDRFEELLSLLGPTDDYKCAGFFRRFISLLKVSHSPVSSKFLQEVHLLSTDGSSAINAVVPDFIRLPAADYREQFYNLLTGFCLEGYERHTEQFLKAEQGEELLSWYQTRLLDHLYQLIHIPLWTKDATPHELVLVCRVKAALNILYYRFLERRKKQYRGIHWAYQPAEGLRRQLAETGLEEVQCLEIMNLFERLTRGSDYLSAAQTTEVVSRHSRTPSLRGSNAGDSFKLKE